VEVFCFYSTALHGQSRSVPLSLGALLAKGLALLPLGLSHFFLSTLVLFRFVIIQAYLRFVHVPHLVRNLTYQSVTTAGPLPALIDGHHIVPTKKIIPHLKAQYPDKLDLDKSLSPAKRAEVRGT